MYVSCAFSLDFLVCCLVHSSLFAFILSYFIIFRCFFCILMRDRKKGYGVEWAEKWYVKNRFIIAKNK